MSDSDSDYERITGRRRPRSEITPQSARRRRTRRRQPSLSLEIPEPPLLPGPGPLRSDGNLVFEQRLHEMGFDSDWEEIYPSLRQQQQTVITPTGVGDIFDLREPPTPEHYRNSDNVIVQEIENDATDPTVIVTPGTTVGSRTPSPRVTDERFNRWITPTITNSTNECPVCLTGFIQEDDIVQMRNCIHVYHRGCIRRWCVDNNRNNCPMCRAEYQFGRPMRRKRKRKYY